MKTKVEILDELGILDDIRHGFLRIGQDEPENWDQIDLLINRMSNDPLTSRYAEWEIGDSNWWSILKRVYDKLAKCNPDKK